jgi:hypothetical protein
LVRDRSNIPDRLTRDIQHQYLWQAPIIPNVDFNEDGIVDVKDVAILTNHWGES